MTIKRTFEFNPSPGELAREFASWGDIEQAEFFEHVFRELDSWGSHKKDMQVLGIGQKLRDQWPNAAQMVRELAADTDDTTEAKGG